MVLEAWLELQRLIFEKLQGVERVVSVVDFLVVCLSFAFLLCMGLLGHISAYHKCWRTEEEDIKSPGTRLTDGYELSCDRIPRMESNQGHLVE